MRSSMSFLPHQNPFEFTLFPGGRSKTYKLRCLDKLDAKVCY